MGSHDPRPGRHYRFSSGQCASTWSSYSALPSPSSSPPSEFMGLAPRSPEERVMTPAGRLPLPSVPDVFVIFYIQIYEFNNILFEAFHRVEIERKVLKM
ncbi:hypothetical protein E2C01_068282 [Portunus trituberculatus]|uniref:Uncharacterized protein n=1 Tax=Portunus trituberculatus TaxID=210409 RepID=A0A5B7HW34_PORTR|nr:hypothetical protein [Portunus trituberculatus]